MKEINGFDNEYEFVKYFNGKRIRELNPNAYDLVKSLFPFENENSIIKCWRNHYKQKSDILIRINNKMKGVSIKMGSRNSVHVEPITEFVHFLIENNVSKESVEEYLKYHYADGTMNGNGRVRMSAVEYKINNQDKIDKLNLELNNEELIKKSILRFVLKGTNSEYSIDALIYGEVDDFLWISSNDLMNIIMSKKDLYSTAVHIGALVVQPQNRCLNYNPKYIKARFCVQVKWYSLFDDIMENLYIKSFKSNNLNF